MKLSRQQKAMIESLYAEHFVLLLCYVESVLRNRDAAEEAVQETFRIACARADRLAASENPGGWLMNTLKNTLHNRTRFLARLHRALPTVPLEEALVPGADAPGDLDLTISTLLTAEEYRLYRRLIADGDSVRRVAEELGISVSACKKRAQRIREKLREALRA